MAVPKADDQKPASASIAARLKAAIARKRGVMRAVVVTERIWPLLVPVLCVAALFASLSWFGFFHAVPLWLHVAALALLLAGLLWALSGLRTFRWPDGDAIDRRLERVNRIEHQALAVQDDRLENETGFSRALWLEHRRRMAERIADLRTGMPEPDTPRRDPYALRALVVLLFVTAFAYSHSNRAGFLGDALSFSVSGAPAAPVRIDAWVTPPAYTGRAPIFLTRAEGDVPDSLSLPAGSEVTVRISGGDAPRVTYRSGEDASGRAIEPAGAAEPQQHVSAGGERAASRTYRFKPAADGRLAIAEGSAEKGWSFTVIPDKKPTIAFAGEPKSTVNGALELSYTVADDYGIEKARAVIVPADPPGRDAHPLYGPPEFPLSLPGGGARSGKMTTNRDLTDHPLAGRRVRITLVATDGAGQEGRSKTIVTRLPERHFSNPLSRAVIEQRQTFALDTNRLQRAIDLADALMTAPEETIANPSHFLLLKTARERMALARNDDMLRDAADYLWQIALGLENGDLSLAQQRLRDAQRALSEALKNNASDAEIQRLMKELRQAMNDFMKEMAKQAMKNPGQTIPDNMKNVLRQQDLERMMNQIENLARSGQRQQAEQLLSQLQQMMNNLQAGRTQRGQQSSGPMRQQMDKLGELLRQQQQLMNQTYQLNQQLQDQLQQSERQQQGEQGKQGQQDQQGQQSQNGRPLTAEQLRQALKELRRQQQSLRDQLGQLQQSLKGLGIKPGKGFGDADKAMGNATGALGKGEGERALGEQGRALQALRQGAQDMMSQMMQAMGQRDGQGQGQPRGDRMGRNDRDPLGRPRSTSGPDFGDQVKVPDEIDIQRAREILNQIRKRLGDALSPALEKQYLERLLDMR